MWTEDTNIPPVRWIAYTSQNIPGNQSFELGFHSSLVNMRNAYLEYCDAVGTDDVSMSVYYVPADERDAMISVAKEFDGIGCPFDYPSKIVERGPRGGTRFVNA